jgi:hypothetical protein
MLDASLPQGKFATVTVTGTAAGATMFFPTIVI